MNKKNLLIGSALVLAALLVVGGTMAWFTAAAEPVTNTFTAGTVNIKLHDVQMDNGEELLFPENGIGNVNPGDEYEKIVYVENTGTKAVYVRVKLTPAWTKGESSLPLQVGGVNMATFPIVDDRWVPDGDWYYFKDPLAPGHSTGYLINKVEFAGVAMTNDYQGATFTLTVSRSCTGVS